MTDILRISNRQLRRALIELNGLGQANSPNGFGRRPPVHEIVRQLGFVQVDSICAIERAHHHILFRRNPGYRHEQLSQALEQDRTLFENWTHDAAILPVELYPYWRHYFERVKRFEAHPGYRNYFAPVRATDRARVLRRIKRDGPLRPRDLGSDRVAFRDPYFASPSLARLTMELLWRTGKLAVTRREGQQKVYDLAERVIPARQHETRVGRDQYRDWACRAALERLGIAGPAAIARFFDAVTKEETQAWCRRRVGGELVEVEVGLVDGKARRSLFARVDQVPALLDAPPAPRRLRLINPFDPLIHDRRRTAQVFGFDYRIEIWVPAAKRRFGYYVLPVLEGERFTGRVDARADRKQDRLVVQGLWWEPGIRSSASRLEGLERELRQLARLAGVSTLSFSRRVRQTGRA